ncbi:MAG: arylsulfatase B [Myxococcota bacterium]
MAKAMRRLCWLALLAALACSGPPEPPNLVVLMADDLGWGDVGFHDGPWRTPAIDRLAAEGTELAQFYVLPVCSPTRAALLTGRHPLRYGMQQGATHLPLGERTLAQDLRAAGYVTAVVGKWHLGWGHPAYRPLQRGFDHQYGLYTGATDYFERSFAESGEPNWFRDDRELREEGYATDLIAAEAVRLIEGRPPDRPFFLWVSFNAPHLPLQAAERHRSLYPEMPPTPALYGQVLAGLDEGVASVLDALDREGLREDTLVLFLSDNGPSGNAPGSAGKLRGRKHLLYEGGVRVPAVARWPGELAAGGRFDAPLHVVDLRPTLLALAGAALPADAEVDGLDASAALREGAPLEREELLYNADPARERTSAIRRGDWKLIQRGSRAQLFDLSRDPYETQNLAFEHPEIVAELAARLDVHRARAVPAVRGGRMLLPRIDRALREAWQPPPR